MTEPKLDLAKAIFDRIEELGVEKASEFFQRPVTTIKKWAGGTVLPDVAAAQKVLDEAMETGLELPAFSKPPPQGETKPPEDVAEEHRTPAVVSDGDKSQKVTLLEPKKTVIPPKKFSIVCPINREMSYAVVLSMLGNWKATLPEESRKELAVMDFEPDTLIHTARNILATRFLASGNEWSFWFDSDIIAPIGNPAWFRRRTGMTKHADKWFSQPAIERLTTRGKTFVGAVYAERNHSGHIITQPGLSPTGDNDKKLIDDIKKKGPEDRVVQVGWLGFGCVAVHRKVFEDILAGQPGVKAKKEGDPHGFFTAFEEGPKGEDTAFSKRAAQAGHPAFLDLSVWAAHIGRYAFLP